MVCRARTGLGATDGGFLWTGLDGWRRFGCSCYFTSSEAKTWSEGRRECTEGKGSDLVVINSREEQDFVSGLMEHDEFWIGLRTTGNKPVFKWEWVDESPLTETFWAGLSVPPTELYVAAYSDRQGKLTQSKYDGGGAKRFICEK
ncbi:C-type lectin domain family 4 member A-like [Betta splendens]|uniref:C-type lectin domain family 4 member A-like n=1 Tax=Betta splendens TaxID=158456 RepID=A0A8M1HL32_BETSP|nr:C-type lectin domain family 4 member A-like [Betta splendens]